jgi:hypothetical protein
MPKRESLKISAWGKVEEIDDEEGQAAFFVVLKQPFAQEERPLNNLLY